MTPIQTFMKLRDIAKQIAREESLPLLSIERSSPKGTRGICHSDGRIYITVHSSPTMLERVKLQENARTLSHELAHLRYMNHSHDFWKYAGELSKKFEEKLGISIPPEKAMMK